MTCPSCEAAATDWACGSLRANCPGCTVRDLANSPPMIRRAEYLRITTLRGRDEALRLRDEVQAEKMRIAKLRSSALNLPLQGDTT